MKQKIINIVGIFFLVIGITLLLYPEIRDAESAAPVAPKRTERVDDFADFSFGKIEL